MSVKEYKIVRGYGLDILNKMISNTPSNYPKVNFTNMGMYWRFITKEFSRLSRSNELYSRNIYLDEASDTALYVNFGYMLHPENLNVLQETYYPYKNFLNSLKTILLNGSNPEVLEANIKSLIGFDVNILEYVKDPTKDISDQFGFTFSVSIPEGTPSFDLSAIQQDVSYLLNIVKPAHTYYSFIFQFDDTYGGIKDEEIVEQEVTQYFYDSYQTLASFTLDLDLLDGDMLLYPSNPLVDTMAMILVETNFVGEGRKFILDESELDEEYYITCSALQIETEELSGAVYSSGYTSLFLDEFTRADGPVLNDWSVTDGGIRISSNAVVNIGINEGYLLRGPVGGDYSFTDIPTGCILDAVKIDFTTPGTLTTSGFGIYLASSGDTDMIDGAMSVSFNPSGHTVEISEVSGGGWYSREIENVYWNINETKTIEVNWVYLTGQRLFTLLVDDVSIKSLETYTSAFPNNILSFYLYPSHQLDNTEIFYKVPSGII